MDHGTLTDTNGKPTDFRHVILLMTSNIGAREMAGRTPGFGGEQSDAAGGRSTEGDRAFERLFSPEFRNRLDARLQFKPLSPLVMGRIVDKLVRELSTQLAERNVEVELTEAARGVLSEKGYDPAFGARPLARVLDETVKRPLTDELLFGQLEHGGKVTVDAEGGEIVLRYQAAEGLERSAEPVPLAH
jgi:ATP-dependent Clp protease ATP-binding subunit ClpA